MKMKEFGPPGGRASLAPPPPLDPPMGLKWSSLSKWGITSKYERKEFPWSIYIIKIGFRERVSRMTSVGQDNSLDKTRLKFQFHVSAWQTMDVLESRPEKCVISDLYRLNFSEVTLDIEKKLFPM